MWGILLAEAPDRSLWGCVILGFWIPKVLNDTFAFFQIYPGHFEYQLLLQVVSGVGVEVGTERRHRYLVEEERLEGRESDKSIIRIYIYIYILG